MLKNPDRAIGEIELSQVVKAAAVIIGAQNYPVDSLSLQQLADTAGDDDLMEMFKIFVAARIELEKNGATIHFYDLHGQRIAIGTKISDRTLRPIDYDTPPLDNESRRRFEEVSRELSALSYGMFELAGALDLSKPSPSRKS